MGDGLDKSSKQIQYYVQIYCILNNSPQQMVKIVDNYALSEVIGKGQYGKVYKATHIDSKMLVAIKCIDIQKFEEVSKLTECTKNEIDTLMTIQDNINIIKFVEMIKTSNNIYLVYEYCQGGTLDQEIRKYGKLAEKKALLYFKQLMNAFKSLSDNKIYHRDIKPDNILLKSGHLKVADFGFCKRMQSIQDLTQTILGSPVYMAPEVLNGEMYNSRADVWSLGIVLFEMIFGYCPFGQGSISDLMNHIKNFSLQIPKGAVSHCTEGLLQRMLERDSFRRLTWEDLFYQYEVSDFGMLIRKEKGFEYDLMKLMKKNSRQDKNKKPIVRSMSYKFNWEKITQRKSEVKSVELDSNQRISNLDEIIEMKKKIKQLSSDHTLCHQAAGILTQVLKRNYSEESSHVALLICQTILTTLHNLMRKTIDFQAKNHKYLTNNRSELESIQKLLLVLSHQKKTLIPKLLSLKLQLCSRNPENPEVIKFESCSSIRNTVLRRYFEQVNKKYPSCQSFERNELDKDVTLHLLRILIAVNMQKEKEVVVVNQQKQKLFLIKELHLRKNVLSI